MKNAIKNALKNTLEYDFLDRSKRNKINQAANDFGKAIKFFDQGKSEDKWQGEIEKGLERMEDEDAFADIIVVLHDDGTVTSYVTLKAEGPPTFVIWDERD